MSDEPGYRQKLIDKKQDWAREGRLLTGTHADPSRVRLPPGQRLVRHWPVLDLGVQPNVTPAKFRLDIDGAVEKPASLTLDALMALPQVDSVSDMHCVTQWSHYDNHCAPPRRASDCRSATTATITGAAWRRARSSSWCSRA